MKRDNRLNSWRISLESAVFFLACGIGVFSVDNGAYLGSFGVAVEWRSNRGGSMSRVEEKMLENGVHQASSSSEDMSRAEERASEGTPRMKKRNFCENEFIKNKISEIKYDFNDSLIISENVLNKFESMNAALRPQKALECEFSEEGNVAVGESIDERAKSGMAVDRTQLRDGEPDEATGEKSAVLEACGIENGANALRVESGTLKQNVAPLTSLKDEEYAYSDSAIEGNAEFLDNPAVSSRLTNMSIRHVGARPDWFDIEPVKLPGIVRQCRRVFYKIASSLERHEKQMILLSAGSGMGKTTFLAQVYGMLEHIPDGVLTLAPGCPKKSPFRALRNILEQRFYISGKASFPCIERFVRGAIASIVTDSESETVNGDIDAILDMWRLTRSNCSLGKREVLAKKGVSLPPPVKTQIVSMEEVVSTSCKRLDVSNSKCASVSDSADERERSISSISGGAEETLAAQKDENSHDRIPNGEGGALENGQTCEEGGGESACDASASFSNAHGNGADIGELQSIENVEKGGVSKCEEDGKEAECIDSDAKGACEARKCESSDKKSFSSSATLESSSLGRAALNPDEAAIEAVCRRLEPALLRLIQADLRQNAIVIVIDDIEKYDSASLEVLSRVYELLGDARFCMLWTTSNPELLPEKLKSKPYIEPMRLEPMSDTDLTLLTKHVFRTLGSSREKMLIPQEICRHIAQRAYGSPKRAIEMVREHFKPDEIIHWNEAIDKIRHEPLPREIGLSIVERFKSCHEMEQLLLQLAAHLSVPFTCATLQSIVSGLEEWHGMGDLRCLHAFVNLRKLGFFERSEESLSQKTPSFVFRHDCERIVIAGGAPKALRSRIYARAAQWYTLINRDGKYDEAIGDMWRYHQSLVEAGRHYERAAYRAYRQSLYVKAWPLFSKLLKCLPETDLAHKIVVSLDSAKIAFRIGLVDESFRLCRWTCYNALQLCAYSQAARANMQIAAMLVELGSTRHVMRYIKRTRALLNIENDAQTELELEIVMVNYALARSDKALAKHHMERVEALSTKMALSSYAKHGVSLLSGMYESQFGCPAKAAAELERLISDCESSEDLRVRALAYHHLGKTHEKMENLTPALEAWNSALGLAQEMNDVVLHASVLADISDGALSLDATRTARAAIEQSLAAAQQTRQRALIARCLVNTAYLQNSEGQYEKAMRTLRKAHKSATHLRSMAIWAKVLRMTARFYQQAESPFYQPQRSNEIYRHLLAIYESYHQPLGVAQVALEYAKFLDATHQNLAAMSMCRKARQIYLSLDMPQSGCKAQSLIDEMKHEDAAVLGDTMA